MKPPNLTFELDNHCLSYIQLGPNTEKSRLRMVLTLERQGVGVRKLGS